MVYKLYGVIVYVNFLFKYSCVHDFFHPSHVMSQIILEKVSNSNYMIRGKDVDKSLYSINTCCSWLKAVQ